MNRAARLLDLIELLRSHRRPVTGETLADALGVSLRTLYRDIETLKAQGVPIASEAGLGFLLRPGLTVPPLMFDEGELDALVLGLRLVGRRLPDDLGDKAASALAKIDAVLPRGRSIGDVALFAGPSNSSTNLPFFGAIRDSVDKGEVLDLVYTDAKGRRTRRAVWAIAIGFFGAAEVLAAWCEKRQDFRHFRLDRIVSAQAAGRPIGRPHRFLLAEWRLIEGAEDLY